VLGLKQMNVSLSPIKDTRGLGSGPGLASPNPFKHTQANLSKNKGYSN
jgi:hypothetical protein